jgi:hypothetical protein
VGNAPGISHYLSLLCKTRLLIPIDVKNLLANQLLARLYAVAIELKLQVCSETPYEKE